MYKNVPRNQAMHATLLKTDACVRVPLSSMFLIQGKEHSISVSRLIMTKLVSCHRFTVVTPAVHLGKESACICHGNDHITALHKTSNNSWHVTFEKVGQATQHQGCKGRR